MGVKTYPYRKKNKHGRRGVRKPRPLVTLSMEERGEIYREAWKDGYRTGMKDSGEEATSLLRRLLKIEKKTEIHQLVRQYLGLAS